MLAATAGQAVDLAPLTDDHQAIRAAADRASQALASFRGAPGTLAELHASASQLRDLLDEHIADEEQQILAAMRLYLPADVYRWCEQQTRRKAALPGLRFTAPWLARHAQPGELNRLLAARQLASPDRAGRHPPPVRPAGTPGIRHVTEPSGGGMTGSTDTSPRPGLRRRDGGDHKPVGQRQEHHHQADRRHRPAHGRHGDGQRPPAGPDDRGAARGLARPSARGPKPASTVR